MGGEFVLSAQKPDPFFCLVPFLEVGGGIVVVTIFENDLIDLVDSQLRVHAALLVAIVVRPPHLLLGTIQEREPILDRWLRGHGN